MDQFEPKDVIGEAVRRTIGLLRQYRRGNVIPWAVFEGAVGCARQTEHWTQAFKRVRRDFLNATGITLWPEAGVGVKLQTTQEQLEHRSAYRQRKALRQLGRDIKELLALPDQSLTMRQREQKSRKLEQARASRRAVLRGVRAGHTLFRASGSGIPRPKPTRPAA